MRISDWSSDVCSSDLAEEGDVPFAREADAGDLAFGPALAEAAGHEDAVHRLEIGGEVVVGLEHLCVQPADVDLDPVRHRSEEHKSELQSLMRISYAVFCLIKKIIRFVTKRLHILN